MSFRRCALCAAVTLIAFPHAAFADATGAPVLPTEPRALGAEGSFGVAAQVAEGTRRFGEWTRGKSLAVAFDWFAAEHVSVGGTLGLWDREHYAFAALFTSAEAFFEVHGSDVVPGFGAWVGTGW